MDTQVTFVFWHWFAFAAVLGAVEILAPGVFFLWLAVAAFITGLLLLLFPTLGVSAQLVIFGVLAVALVYMAWKYLKRNPIASDQPLLNQRSAQNVGKLFTLEDAIVNGTGRVRIGDSTWKVEGAEMATGTQVRVTGFDGAVLKVEKVAEPPAQPATAATNRAEATSVDPLKESLADPLNRSQP